MNIRTLLILPVLFLALAISLGGGVALADEAEDDRDHEADELEITYSWSPRFPIAGEEAECIITVLHDGSPVQGLPVSVTLERAEDQGHHDEGEADDHDADAETQDETGTHDDADEHTEGDDADSADGTIELIATEIEPGIYVIKTAFAQNGPYSGTIQIADQQTDVAALVRSSAVAWPLLMVFAGVPALLACGIAVMKTARKRW